MLSSKNLREAVLRTLSYAEVFQHSPSQREIVQFLHAPRVVSAEELRDIPEFRSCLETNHNRALFREKWKAVNSAVKLFSFIPWLKGVWVTGALAAGSVKDDDDIDFLFLTDPQRLWLSRACVVLVGMMIGKYRSRWRRGSQKNLWCCNIWLEPDVLALSSERQSLYEARELVQAVPVFVRHGEKSTALLEANLWARRFVANGFVLAWRRSRCLVSSGWRPVRRIGFLESFMNNCLLLLQKQAMLSKMTREEVGPTRAFFHPRDTRSWVKRRYETICDVKKIRPWFNEPAP